MKVGTTTTAATSHGRPQELPQRCLSQVLLTPGIIFGRFKIGQDSPTRPINLIIGAGYQFAVTSDPVVKNNWVATLRVTF